MGSNTAVCNLQILFVYHYPERSNTYVSVFLTVVDWSKDDSTYRFLLSTLMVGQPPNRKGAIESLKWDDSVFLIPAIDHPGICSWQTMMVSCTACWFRSSPSYSLLLSRMVYHRAVLSLQFFASCVALDPYFRKCMHDKDHENMISNVQPWIYI